MSGDGYTIPPDATLDVKKTTDVEFPRLRLDVQNELIEAIRSGRMRIVSREDYVVNGQTLAKVTLEEIEDDARR